MKHIVLNQEGRPYKAGDEVRVQAKGEHYGKFGEVHTVRNYDNDPRIGVSFDGEVYSFKPDEIKSI